MAAGQELTAAEKSFLSVNVAMLAKVSSQAAIISVESEREAHKKAVSVVVTGIPARLKGMEASASTIAAELRKVLAELAVIEGDWNKATKGSGNSRFVTSNPKAGSINATILELVPATKEALLTALHAKFPEASNNVKQSVSRAFNKHLAGVEVVNGVLTAC